MNEPCEWCSHISPAPCRCRASIRIRGLEARVAELTEDKSEASPCNDCALTARVAELEAEHPEWMKRIQREREEERGRIIAILLDTDSPYHFMDYYDDDQGGIQCWDEVKLRNELDPAF